MGMFGGGGQAGGWSQGIGGQGGQQPHRRGADGWDEEYLGKVYDAEVVRRVLPYLKEYKIHAAISLVTMTIAAVLQFIQPLFIGQIVKQLASIHGPRRCGTLTEPSILPSWHRREGTGMT